MASHQRDAHRLLRGDVAGLRHRALPVGCVQLQAQAVAIEKVKRRYIGDLEAGFDDLDGLCGWFGGTELFFRPYSHLERARRIARVTAEDVRTVAARIFAPERLTAVAVGPVKPKLAKEVRTLLRTMTVPVG